MWLRGVTEEPKLGGGRGQCATTTAQHCCIPTPLPPLQPIEPQSWANTGWSWGLGEPQEWRAEWRLRQGWEEGGPAAPAGELYLHRVLLVGDEVHAGLDSGVGPFSQHLLLQLVNICQGRGHLSCWPHCTQPGDIRRAQPCPRPRAAPGVPEQPHSPSNLPEKLSVALQRFFFLFLFLASGMSMG